MSQGAGFELRVRGDGVGGGVAARVRSDGVGGGVAAPVRYDGVSGSVEVRVRNGAGANAVAGRAHFERATKAVAAHAQLEPATTAGATRAQFEPASTVVATRAQFEPATTVVACVVAAFVVGACTAPANASVLLDVASFRDNGLPGLRAPTATLDVVDGKGKALDVDVLLDDGTRQLVTSPIPVPCDATDTCGVTLATSPGLVSFTLHLSAADRCGTRAELLRFTAAPVQLQPYQTTEVDLTLDKADFDDDGDGISNVLENATCGRVDVADGAAPPQACSDPNDPCCAGVSPLEGHLTAFAGGAHARADNSNVDVAPFAIDATEVTWRQFARCVAGGACLAGNPDHPVRQALAAGVVDTEPVVGLTPAEAEAVCEYFGERLPSDDEWDFAAAQRADPSVRGKYPWDDDAAAVGCRADFAGVSANFSIPGSSCAGAPSSVGAFSSSFAARGAGVAIADLGGNVAEWTLIAGDGESVPEVPTGNSAVVLRGGGALSPLALLENDLPVVAADPGSAQAWSDTVNRLKASAGFRCAKSVDDGTVAPIFTDEPACAAGPGGSP